MSSQVMSCDVSVVVCRRVRHVKLLAAQFDIDEAVLTAFPSGITVGIRINKCSEVRSACLNDSQIHLSFYVIRRPVPCGPAPCRLQTPLRYMHSHKPQVGYG